MQKRENMVTQIPISENAVCLSPLILTNDDRQLLVPCFIYELFYVSSVVAWGRLFSWTKGKAADPTRLTNFNLGFIEWWCLISVNKNQGSLSGFWELVNKPSQLLQLNQVVSRQIQMVMPAKYGPVPVKTIHLDDCINSFVLNRSCLCLGTFHWSFTTCFQTNGLV